MPVAVPAPAPEDAALDIDCLDAYRVAVQFAAIASRLRVTPASLRDQLHRASASIVLNLAEGCGRHSAADRAHFFSISRGSALECAAVLDLLRARAAVSEEVHRQGRGLIVRVVQMTTRLACIGGRRSLATPRE